MKNRCYKRTVSAKGTVQDVKQIICLAWPNCLVQEAALAGTMKYCYKPIVSTKMQNEIQRNISKNIIATWTTDIF